MMAALRPLFVNENIGGHATLHLNLRRALEAHPEVSPTFLDVPDKGPWRRLLSARVPGLDRLDADLQQLRFQLAQSNYVRRRLAGCRAQHDVVHFYTQNTAMLSVDLLRSTPSVVSTDSTNDLHARQLPYRRPGRLTSASVRLAHPFEQRVLDAATMVVAQSQWVAASLRERYGVKDDRLQIIPFGVFIPPPLERSRPASPLRITFVGTSMARKGGWALLDVYRRHLRDGCVLSLVTREEVTPEPGVEVHRDVQPGDGRLAQLLADTDVFAFPSEVDKSSYAVLEALAAGVPVVTTDMAALPELVGSEAGVLVPPGDRAALAEALSALLSDDTRRRTMAAAARRRAAERFDARATTRQLLEVLHQARHCGGVGS